jgi:hypothetical protein
MIFVLTPDCGSGVRAVYNSFGSGRAQCQVLYFVTLIDELSRFYAVLFSVRDRPVVCAYRPFLPKRSTSRENGWSAPDQQTFHVSANGNERNPGTQSQPFASLGQARDAVRSFRSSFPAPTGVRVHAGTYYLSQPRLFGAQDSGTSDAPITYAAAPGELVTPSGGRSITGHWQP